MKVALIGPMPPPMNGCSYANEVFFRNTRADVRVEVVDTSTPIVSGAQGDRFSLRKALAFVGTYLAIPKLIGVDVVYMTPGQTLFGVLKYAPFMLVGLLLRKPYVIHLHGNHLGAHYASLRGINRKLFAFFVGRSSAAIVLSESLRANFVGLLSAERVFVVENFAGDGLFQSVEKPIDMPRILYLSNLMLEKGILVLLDALAQLQQLGIAYKAVIAGQIEAGLEQAVGERLAQLGECVQYVGTVSGNAKLAALQQANIFVLPTFYAMEGQPISLLEGLATGNIIITTAHAGIPDIIDDSNGYVVPIRDSNAIAAAVREIAIDVPARVSEYSANNAAYAAERFTEQRFSNRIVDVLQWAARGGHKASTHLSDTA